VEGDDRAVDEMAVPFTGSAEPLVELGVLGAEKEGKLTEGAEEVGSGAWSVGEAAWFCANCACISAKALRSATACKRACTLAKYGEIGGLDRLRTEMGMYGSSPACVESK